MRYPRPLYFLPILQRLASAGNPADLRQLSPDIPTPMPANDTSGNVTTQRLRHAEAETDETSETTPHHIFGEE